METPSPFALETFYIGSRTLKASEPLLCPPPDQKLAKLANFANFTWREYHRQRLYMSCRFLGLAPPSVELWQQVCHEVVRHSKPDAILSLRYHSEAEWQLTERPYPYNWDDLNALDTAPSTENAGVETPKLAPVTRLGLLRGLALCPFPSAAETHRRAKSQKTVELALGLSNLQERWSATGSTTAKAANIEGRAAETDVVDEVLLHNTHLLEGTKTNIFLVHDKAPLLLRTPSLRHQFIAGTVRRAILYAGSMSTALSDSCCIRAETLYLKDLLSCDAVLLCNAVMGMKLLTKLYIPQVLLGEQTSNLVPQTRYLELKWDSILDKTLAASPENSQDIRFYTVSLPGLQRPESLQSLQRLAQVCKHIAW